MMEWKEMSANEFCQRVTDGTHDSPKPETQGHYLITSKHIGKGVIDYSTANIISEEDYQKVIKRSAVEQFDILFSMIGTVGNIYRETSSVIDYAVKNMGIFKMGGDNIKSIWLYYWLQSPKARAYIFERLAGSTQSYLTLDSLRKFPIYFPAEEKCMHRVANILSSLDSKIELNNKINAQLEEMAQAIFKSWFVDFEPFKDGKFVESELGMIPEGWRVGTLGEIAEIVGGSTPSKAKNEYYTTDGIAWLTPKDLSVNKAKFTSKGEIDITEAGYKSTSTKLMPKGSVLFSSRAPIGYITIAKNEICTNQGFKSAVPKIAGTAFLYCFLKDKTSEIESKSTGSTFKEASGALIKSLAVTVPSIEIYKDFEEKLSSIFRKQELIEEESANLSHLRDTLLPKLMSGEIEI